MYTLAKTYTISSHVPLSVVLPLLALLFALYTTWATFAKHGPKEPPYVYSKIPFIGHIIGMIRYGAKYFDIVNKDGHPIFALPMLNTRNYIVADPTIAGHIQRNSKTLSFYSLIVEVTRRLIAFDKDAARISMYNMNGEHGPGGLMEVVHDMMNRHLAPGPGLDSITAVQMEHMAAMLNDEVPPGGAPIVTNLYAWQRRIFSFCNMLAVYGPNNIFAMHAELEKEFWDFEHGMLGLVVDIAPSITSRKSYMARRKVLDGLIEFVKTERYKKACPLIQERVQTNLSFGLSLEMAGHAELVLMFGILGNAVPSNFWLIANIFARPELLQRIRVEVQDALELRPAVSSEARKEISIVIPSKAINMKSCPLLYSCYRETLRDISLLTSPRMVMDKTAVPGNPGGGDYVLRKGSIVQIAGGVMGHDRKVWGEDADSWNPERFLIRDDPTTSHYTAAPLPSGVPSAAFRAYGGGTVICPGRHFAQSELMTLAAVLALGFEITEPDGSPLKLPEKDGTRIPLSVMKPTFDPLVKIARRPGWEYVKWEIGL